jgi:hypothetical protein
VQRCEGAQLANSACSDTVSAAGTPGQCVAIEEEADEAGSVACGDDACDTQSEFCRACNQNGSVEVGCLPRQEETWDEELQAQLMAGECDFVAQLYLQCDASEDCPDGQECVFSSGENGYAFCTDGDTFSYGVACTSEADCDEEAPGCGEFDPLGYFAAFADLLGWLPVACSGE